MPESMSPRVTAIIPVHNGREHLPGLLEKVRGFAGPDVEVLIVDDASTDGTGDHLARWPIAELGVRVLVGPGRGVAAARNLAVAEARGMYVWFGDCDDEWDSDILAALVDEALRTSADVVLCNAAKLSPGGERLGMIEDAPDDAVMNRESAFRALLTAEIQGHLWNKLFQRTVLGDSPFPPTRAHSDLGGVIGVLGRAHRIARVPRPLYRYIIHMGSILNSRQYRWSDLTDCLELATRSAMEIGLSGDDRDLRLFRLTHVVLPLLNESIRRQGIAPADEVRAARRTCRDLCGPKDVHLLASAGHRAAALKLALFVATPSLYARAYSQYRRTRWAQLDAF